MRRSYLVVAGITLGAAALLFGRFNRARVTVDFGIFETVEVPLWLIIYVSLVLGWLLPRLFGISRWLRHNRERVELRRRCAELEREVVQLRNVPIDLEDPADRRKMLARLGRRAPARSGRVGDVDDATAKAAATPAEEEEE